jgi:hypothetical protein
MQCCTCQCTQCRKNTGVLLFRVQMVPISAVTFTPPLQASLRTASPLKRYYATPGIARGFCGDCGSFLFWFDESRDRMDLLVGGFDEEYLQRYGEVLTTAGSHMYCAREIKGVTDHLKGKRYELDSAGEVES